MSKKSTTSKAAGKVGKPRPDFPLFPHASGRWAKKVRGAFAYFGKVSGDTSGAKALELWLEQRDDLLAGRKPRRPGDPGGVTVKELCDQFLAAKEALVTTGEMARRSFNDLHGTCLKVADTFGRQRLVSDLRPDDFALLRTKFAKGVGLVSLSNDIRRTKNLFRWGFESELVENAARFGLAFKPPTLKALRIARVAKGPRCFEQADLRRIIDTAGVQLKPMVLLGINCGLGNADCARLQFRHVDLKTGWLDFPRPKTGEPRRCPLWPETVKALKAAIAARPEPKDPNDKALVFITKYGGPWREDSSRNSPLSHEFAKVLDDLGLKRPGLNFYAIRHTLQTIGEGALDRAALARIMGHVTPATDMSGAYRERIDDSRLVAVSQHMRRWLFPPTPKKRKPR